MGAGYYCGMRFPKLPSVTYYLDRHIAVDAIQELPGVSVFGIPDSGSTGRGSRWEYLPQRPSMSMFKHLAIKAPVHAVRLVDAALASSNVRYRRHGDYQDPIPAWLEATEEAGRLIMAAREGVGLPAGAAAAAKPQQAHLLAAARGRPAWLLVSPPGTGKTLAALRAVEVHTTGAVLVCCPSNARPGWARAVRQYTQLEAHRVLAVSDRPKAPTWKLAEGLLAQRGKSPTLHLVGVQPDGSTKTLCGRRHDAVQATELATTCGSCERALSAAKLAWAYEEPTAYIDRMRATGQRAVVIVPHEGLPDCMELAEYLQPSVVIWDETHLLASHQRTTRVPQRDGKSDYVPKRTKTRGSVTRAYAASEITRIDSVRWRFGLDGTPWDEGAIPKGWAQLDLLWPGGWGTYYDFTGRHADGHAGEHGWVCDGASYVDELRERLSWLMIDIPYSRVRSGLPKLRVDVVWLKRADLGDAGDCAGKGWTEVLGALHADMAASVGEGRAKAAAALREMRIAYACAQKRPWMIRKAVEAFMAGGKVMLVVGRVEECVYLLARVVEALIDAGATEQQLEGVVAVHGQMPVTEAEDAIESYVESPGYALMVANYQRIGTAVDGLQTTTRAVIGHLPTGPGGLVQLRGRWDRYFAAGQTPVETEVLIGLADGTEDVREARRIVKKRQQVSDLHSMEEVAELDDELMGVGDIDALLSGVAASMAAEQREAEQWEEEYA